jgi:hypothetical protein
MGLSDATEKIHSDTTLGSIPEPSEFCQHLRLENLIFKWIKFLFPLSIPANKATTYAHNTELKSLLISFDFRNYLSSVKYGNRLDLL